MDLIDTDRWSNRQAKMQSDGIEAEVNSLLEAFSELTNEELKEMIMDDDPTKLNAKLDELVNNSSMVSR